MATLLEDLVLADPADALAASRRLSEAARTVPGRVVTARTVTAGIVSSARTVTAAS